MTRNSVSPSVPGCTWHAAVTHYTLIQSAKRHGVDHFAYLRDVLLRITTKPNTDLHQLLPDRWKAALLS
jgi:hypothetical protein